MSLNYKCPYCNKLLDDYKCSNHSNIVQIYMYPDGSIYCIKMSCNDFIIQLFPISKLITVYQPIIPFNYIINIPYNNVLNITPDNFIHKIKTLLTFS